jgi:hypothetical protein
MAVPDWCGIYLKLSRALMATWLSERISLFPPILLFSIFAITQALLVYISTWTIVVWSPMQAVPPSQASSVHLGTSAVIGLRPLCVPDQSFDVWLESILLFTSARELACEWLVVLPCLSSSVGWVHPLCSRIFYYCKCLSILVFTAGCSEHRNESTQEIARSVEVQEKYSNLRWR